MFKERAKTHHSAIGDGKKYMLGMNTVAEALSLENACDKKNATIYIHVPFCNKICSFCNMRRSLQTPDKNYASLIMKEIEQYAKMPYIQSTTFDAVYFGGGTPTTLDTESLCDILKALKSNFTFTEDAEFTVETTVTELTEEKMEGLIACGVNRFSVGVQTFDDEGRAKMGRVGCGDMAYQRLKQLKAYENVIVSMDLIYNYPNQTMESLYADLDRIIELDLDGFSMYSLINMKETSIDKAQSEDNDKKMFYAIAEYMQAHGYRFLELTKMVKGDQYKYIMNRHQGADTLPLGAGAGGSVNQLAMMNPIVIAEYEKSIEDIGKKQGMQFTPEYGEIVRFKGAVQTVQLPENEAMYRDRAEYERFKEQLLENRMIYKEKNQRYLLTEEGIFWGNSISRKLADML